MVMSVWTIIRQNKKLIFFIYSRSRNPKSYGPAMALLAHLKTCKEIWFWKNETIRDALSVLVAFIKFNALSANPTKWSYILSLSVFDYFVKLALKGLNCTNGTKSRKASHITHFQINNSISWAKLNFLFFWIYLRSVLALKSNLIKSFATYYDPSHALPLKGFQIFRTSCVHTKFLSFMHYSFYLNLITFMVKINKVK